MKGRWNRYVVAVATALIAATVFTPAPGGGESQPLDFEVLAGPPPVIEVDPDSFSFTIPEGGSDADDLVITNIDDGTLTWDIKTAEPAGDVISTWREAAGTPVTGSFARGAGRAFPEPGNLLRLGDGQMSQTSDTNIVPANSIACNIGPNHLLRRFYFDEHPGVGNPAEISSVDIAIQEGVASQTLTVNLYTLPSDTPVDTIPVESLAMIGSGSVTISPADDGTIVNVPVSATVSDTAAFDLVVEATADVFFIGATNTGETHPGFIMVPKCGATTPTPIGPLGPAFEDIHIIMVVNASEGEPAPELVFDPASLDFGDVEVGTTSSPQFATLQNTGDLDATGLTFGPTGGGFEADTSACGDTLSAGTSCPVSVTFTPAEPGAASAVLEVTSDQDASAGLGLSGTGVSGGPVTIRYVDGDTGSDIGDCTNEANPCATISYAIVQANANDTIEIADGDYTESIEVDKSLALLGESEAGTII